MPNEDTPRYEVLLTEPAEVEIEAAYLGRMRFGMKAAERWYAGLTRLLETLAMFPRGFPIARERDKAGGEVRQAIYGSGRSAYRVLYRVFEPTDDESGIVRVLHVRHASREQ